MAGAFLDPPSNLLLLGGFPAGLAVGGLFFSNVKGNAMNDQAIEQEIQAKGLTAPRVTPADIEANIAGEYFFTADAAVTALGAPAHDALRLLTFCVLVLKNGFTVTGESACASPENFDAELGRKIARQNAVAKVWPLMGYEVKTQVHLRQLAGISRG